MADTDKVSIAFEAKLDEITAALGQLSSDFKKFSNDVKDSFGSAGDAVGKLLDQLKKMVAAFISFETLKKSIETTKDLGVQALKLASVFGISTTEASQFAVAIEDVHGTVDQVEHAAAFMSRQFRENADVMARYGLTLVDANGNQKSQKQLFMDSIAVINSYKAGVDRNIASVALWGRGALEFQEILKLTPAGLEESRKKADELGLTLTQQGTVTVMNYRDALQDVIDVMRGFGKVIGEALMPILTALGEWFREIAPAAIQGFKAIMATVASVIWGVVFAIQAIARVAIEVVRTAATAFIGLNDAISKALHGDFRGAVLAIGATNDKLGDDWKDMWHKIQDDAQTAASGIKGLWEDQTPGAPPKTGGKTAPTHDKTLMAQLQADLALKKSTFEQERSAQGEFEKFSLEAERDYWKQYVDDARLNTQERLQIRIKIADLETGIARRGFATEITGLKAQQDEYKSNLEERLRLQLDIQKRVETAFPKGGPEVEAERAKTNAIVREIQARNDKIAEEQSKHVADMQLKSIDSLQADIQEQATLRNISRLQQLDLEKQLEDQRVKIQRDSLNERLKIESEKKDKDLAAIATLNRDKESLEQEHQEKIKAIEREAVTEGARYSIQAQEQVQSAFSNMVFDMIDKFESLGQAMRKLGLDILRVFERIIAERFAENIFGPGTAGGALVNMIVKPMTDAIGKILTGWFGMEAAKTAATTTGETSRVTAQTAAAAEGVVAAKTAAVETIGAYAATAAAGAMASVAAIPFVGWIMAPDVGLEAFTEAMSYIPVALAAAGGFDVPMGMNPVTQLHQREMVLPEKQADVIRSLANGGGTSGDGTHVHFHGDVYGMDDFRSKVVTAVQGARRNFVKGTTS